MHTNITSPSVRSSPFLVNDEFKSAKKGHGEGASEIELNTDIISMDGTDGEAGVAETPVSRFYELDMNVMTFDPTEPTEAKTPTTAIEKLMHDKLLQNIFTFYIFVIFIIA